MTNRLTLFLEEHRERYVVSRIGEVKVGEVLPLLSQSKEGELSAALQEAKNRGAQFAILGIPEDIGPRANCGRGGAHQGWDAFLQTFLNIQANTLFPSASAVLVGEVELQDLQEQSKDGDIDHLRHLCSEIDDRVYPIIREIVSAGLTPVVVGGGHNNAYPIMKGFVEGKQLSAIGCCNCDAHADFRNRNGRHSGNAFRIAYEEELLKAYAIVGLHENYNSQETLGAFADANFRYISFETTHVRREYRFEDALKEVADYLLKTGLPIGIECDLDAIATMSVSAQTPYGLTLEEMAFYVHRMTSDLPVAYLHLAEGAPCWQPVTGERYIGRALTLLVSTFLKAARS